MTRPAWASLGFAGIVLAALVPLLAQGQGQGRGNGGGVTSDAAKKPANHKARQPRPILLGVSGGNATDIANGFCCSGTLGALVTDGATQYILSASHIFDDDKTKLVTGNPVDQAGLVDVNCVDNPADYVANVSIESSINANAQSAVDASIAQVIPGNVSATGGILEIGTISSATTPAFMNQLVKKSGRTTGLSRSRISAVNATVNVGYTFNCGGAQFTTMYTGQIIVSNKGSNFIAAGDSGSLMVEDVATNPRAVGLLYAGSSSIAVANPISDVLTYLSDQLTIIKDVPTTVSMVGAASNGSAIVTDGPTSHAIEVQMRNANRLVAVPGAVGHGVGTASTGNGAAIKIFVREITDRARQSTPNEIEGVRVELEAVGDIVAMTMPCRKKG
jgi:hypothetical protein